MAIDLFRPFIAPEAAELVARTLTPDKDGRSYLGEGPRVQEFEQAFGQLVGLETPLAMNSCTSALDLACHLAGVGLGSEVISTPMTCTATNGVLVNRGAKIVWADVDPITGLIDPVDVSRKRTSRTKAIMAVDWAGRSCDYKHIRQAQHRDTLTDVPIIQDAAHNVFVDPNNRGDYVAWSFQAIKHLTTGDGGALLAPTRQFERARLLRWYGLDRTSSADFRCSQDIKEAGFKYHMNDIAASIGLANLPHTAEIVARHRENAAWYSHMLQGAPGITTPPDDPASSWWLYCVLVDDRASLIDHLAQRGIAASPVHRRNDTHPAFSYPNGPLPGVDAFAEHEVAIPVGWWISENDRGRIAAAVLEWAQSRQLVGAAA